MTHSGHSWVETPQCSGPAVLSRVLVLRLPASGAFGNELQEVPDAAEIVARREWRVGHPHDSPVLAPEHGDARHPTAVLTVTHVLGERGPLVRHHGKRPMPAFCELPLLLWCVRRGDDERGAVTQVRIGAVEPVRPQRAIWTALAHVVDNEQIGLVAEQLGEPHAPAACTSRMFWRSSRIWRR